MEWLWITVAAVIMFAIMIIVFVDVVGCYFFNAPLVVRAYKRLVEMTMRVPLEAAMEFETELFGPVWVSEDHDECVRAFFEKRAPRLVGR